MEENQPGSSKKPIVISFIILAVVAMVLFYFLYRPETITSSRSIKIEFLSNEKLNIINSKFTVSLYGYDELLMDVSATLITQKVYEVTSVPFSIILPLPDNTISLIEKKNRGSVRKAAYYIATEWDSNNDGTINSKGDIFLDYFLDYNKKFPKVNLSSSDTQELYLMQL